VLCEWEPEFPNGLEYLKYLQHLLHARDMMFDYDEILQVTFYGTSLPDNAVLCLPPISD